MNPEKLTPIISQIFKITKELDFFDKLEVLGIATMLITVQKYDGDHIAPVFDALKARMIKHKDVFIKAMPKSIKKKNEIKKVTA